MHLQKHSILSLAILLLLIGCGSAPDHSGLYTAKISPAGETGTISIALQADQSATVTITEDGASREERGDGTWEIQESTIVVRANNIHNHDQELTLKLDVTTYKLLSVVVDGEEKPIDELTEEGKDGVYFKKSKLSGKEPSVQPAQESNKPIEQHPDWVKYKTESEAEGWSYDAATYIGELPKDEDNFFMAKPYDALHYNEDGNYINSERMSELQAILDRKEIPTERLENRLTLHVGEFAEQLRELGKQAAFAIKQDNSDLTQSLAGTPGFPPPGFPHSGRNFLKEEERRRKERRKEMAETAKYKGGDDEIIDVYLSQFDEVLTELREAAKRPGHHFPVHRELASGAKLPHLSTSKSFAIILSQSAKIKLARNDGEGAMENLRLQFRLSEALAGDGPTGLLPLLVSVALGAFAIDVIEEGVQLSQWTDAQLQEIDEWLARRTEFTAAQMERFLQGERLLMLLTLQKQINGEDLLLENREATRILANSNQKSLVQELIFYDRAMKEHIELIRKVKTSGVVDIKAVDELGSKIEKTMNRIPGTYILSRLLLPAVITVHSKTAQYINLQSSARLGIAIEKYRHAKGALPNKLQDLVPDFISAIPVNAQTGEPMDWVHNGAPRYQFVQERGRSNEWKYDAVLGAIQRGDLSQLKALAENGWVINGPKDAEILAERERLLKEYEAEEELMYNDADEDGFDALEEKLLGADDNDPESKPTREAADKAMDSWFQKAELVESRRIPRQGFVDFNGLEKEILADQDALHHAVDSGNAELIQWLLEQGLDTSDTAAIDPSGENAGFGYNRKTQMTVLEYAVHRRSKVAVKALLDAGVLVFRDEEETDPAVNARQFGYQGQGNMSRSVFGMADAEMLPLLLAKMPENKMKNALGEDGENESLLKVALMDQNLPLAKCLIQAGADVNYIPEPSTNGQDPNSRMKMPGMMSGGMMPGMMPGYGMPPMAPMGGYPMDMSMGMRGDRGGMSMSYDKISPLGLAAQYVDKEFFDQLVQNGGDLAKVYSDKSTLLHHAAANEDPAILKSLLETKPMLNQKDEAGKTEIAYAAGAGVFDNIKILQSAGADMNNEPAVSSAISSGNLEMVRFFIEHTKKPHNENPVWENVAVSLYELRDMGMMPYSMKEFSSPRHEEIGQLLIKEKIHVEDVQSVLEGKYRLDGWGDDDLIGVDEDGDGWDAYDEKITGHSDQDPDDMPTQEEVDAALAEIEGELE